jgi:hypothetical protein
MVITCISPSGPRGGPLTPEVGYPFCWTPTFSLCIARRSFAASLLLRGLDLDGAAATDPASDDRESSWNTVGLTVRRDMVCLPRDDVSSHETVIVLDAFLLEAK